MKIKKLFFIFLLVPSFIQAQVPSNPLGLNPSRLKWKQINTDKTQVIFPVGLESQGQRVANTVHYLWDHSNESVGDKNKKTTIILQNQTTVPNGFVTVGPFRSEFFMTPPQFNFNGTADWLDVLAIHEYRHIKQFSNSNRGITKVAKFLLGSWVWGGFTGTALPRWYFEGDAVGIETGLTQAGRGRLPEFNMEYHTLWSQNKIYGYEKASAGSLKDFVPGHYNLGYYLITYGRKEFGPDIWNKVLTDAVKYKGLFYPFSRNLKKHTGLRTPQLYRKTMAALEKSSREKDQQLNLTEAAPINRIDKNTVINYRHPQFLSDGSLVVEKNGYNQIRTIIQLNEKGEESKVFEPGNYSQRNVYLSSAGNRICWAERSNSIRWRGKDFSIIKTYDLETGKKKKITRKSRYFSPDLSNDASQIVTVKVSEDLNVQLVILDAANGSIIKTLPNPENYFISFPRWVPGDKKITFLAQKGESNQIMMVDIEDESIQKIGKPTVYQISNPFPSSDYVYFSGAHTGINNIFAVKYDDPTLYQVTSVPYGAFQPSVSDDEKTLAYSGFDRKGYDVFRIAIDPESWRVYDEKLPSRLELYKVLEEQEGGSIREKIGNETFPVKKFSKWSGLINFHSLLPSINPPVLGASLLSDNKFSTLSAQLGGFYNTNENEFTFVSGITYAEFFPEINIGFTRSNRDRSFYDFAPSSDTSLTYNLFSQDWVENDFSVGLTLPLNLSQGNFFRNLRISADYHLLNLNLQDRNLSGDRVFIIDQNPQEFNDLFNDSPRDNNLNALDLRILYTSFQNRAIQNFNPRFGSRIDLRYRTTVGDSDLSGDVFMARGDFFFPGIGKNHSTQLNLAVQFEEFRDNYKFRNLFFYPRGYGSFINDRIYKVGINYGFPIWFPDLALGSFLFIKSVKTNFFFDFANFQGSIGEDIFEENDQNLRSLGLELTFDVRALRLLEINLGVRYSYLLDANNLGLSTAHEIDFLLFSIGI